MSSEPPATRRSLLAGGLQLALATGLLRHAMRADAMTGALKHEARPWLQRLQDVSAALASANVKPREWQSQVEQTLARLDLADFLKSIDFETLATNARFPTQGEHMERLYFADESGRLQTLAFRPFLFTLRKGTAVVPHGHHNMATLHMVLAGRARVRHFDRVDSSKTHMTLRPATDATCAPGDVSSISDEHHNVHWFEPLSERVLMFNVGVYQVVPGQPFGERDYVDPMAAEAVAGDLLRAPRIDRTTAYAKYGRG